jgi:hypothetical protein
LHIGFWRGSVKNKDEGHLEETGVDRKIILKRFFRKCDGGMDRIDLAQNTDGLRAPLDAVMNIRLP